jgi:hypothetical protein
MSWVGARVNETRVRMSWMGARVNETRARMSWVGARVNETRVRTSWRGARVNETHVRMSWVGARVNDTRGRMRWIERVQGPVRGTRQALFFPSRNFACEILRFTLRSKRSTSVVSIFGSAAPQTAPAIKLRLFRVSTFSRSPRDDARPSGRQKGNRVTLQRKREDKGKWVTLRPARASRGSGRPHWLRHVAFRWSTRRPKGCSA